MKGVIMSEMQSLKDSMELVIRELENKKYAQYTIDTHARVYASILKYMQANKIISFNEKVCTQYLFFRTGIKIDGFYGAGSPYLNRVAKPLQVLLDYIQTKTVKFKIRPKNCPYFCPAQFQNEYISFKEELVYRNYARITAVKTIATINKFLTFLETSDVNSSKSIRARHLSIFLSNYKNCRTKYVLKIICNLRSYLTFLYGYGFIDEDMTKSLPKVRLTRNSLIPYYWKREDVEKLLKAIDRASLKGKRDYAILLLVVRLGLRVSDIRTLKFSNLNWKEKTISLNMQKTKQSLKLPLLDDIGWAIIDYLKNGRPKTTCNSVFIRHIAPYDSFGEEEYFYQDLRRYMIKAGLEIPIDFHCGMHSLRSTLARNMLEAKVALPVISNTLGHQSINTTSIYLKIDLDGLKKCALDPEEVFSS